MLSRAAPLQVEPAPCDTMASMDEASFLKAVLPPDALASGEASCSDIEVGRGDDAAVVRIGGQSTLLTTDSCIEGKHFSLEYFTPEQIGAKAVEAACSDVVAMGGYPKYLLWSLSFGQERSLDFYQALARGVLSSCKRMRASLVGGNVTQGASALELTIAVVGALPPGRSAVTRAGAKVGDVIMVTGMLGASRAGMEALHSKTHGFDQLKRAHLEPRCRFDLIDKVGAHASSMIDISDGLSSELCHLSEASGVSLAINAQKLPVHPEVRGFAAQKGKEPWWYALHSGEEYQLLSTVPAALVPNIPATAIGVVEEGEGVWLEAGDGSRAKLQSGGYDHLSRGAGTSLG